MLRPCEGRQRGLQPFAAGYPFRPVPEASGQARLQDQEVDQYTDDGAPQDQPIAALEIIVGFLELGALQCVDLGLAGLLDVKGRSPRLRENALYR